MGKVLILLKKIENKCTNGKSSYFVKTPVLPSAMDESLPLPGNCETPVKNKKLVPDKAIIILDDKIISLEEKISVLNTEIAALRSFIIEQLLVIKTMVKKNLRIHLYVTQTSSVIK